jgi:uncharacterized membrane protein (UPF0127 family)
MMPLAHAEPKKITVLFPNPDRTVTVEAEVADTQKAHMTGLMNRPELPPGGGMLFIFPYDQVLGFWMKNVLFPIDIIFVTSDLLIESVHENVPPCDSLPCPTYRSLGKVRYAVEVSAGFCLEYGVLPGNRIEFLP